MYCRQCNEKATGTAWQGYHGLTEESLILVPVCTKHSDYGKPRAQEELGRPYGFIPGIITTQQKDVFDILCPPESCPMQCNEDIDCVVCNGKGVI